MQLSVELLGSTFVVVSVGKGDKRIAAKVSMQACLVGEPKCPHARTIKATPKALATGHFHALSIRLVALEFDPAGRRVIVSTQW